MNELMTAYPETNKVAYLFNARVESKQIKKRIHGEK